MNDKKLFISAAPRAGDFISKSEAFFIYNLINIFQELFFSKLKFIFILIHSFRHTAIKCYIVKL